MTFELDKTAGEMTADMGEMTADMGEMTADVGLRLLLNQQYFTQKRTVQACVCC